MVDKPGPIGDDDTGVIESLQSLDNYAANIQGTIEEVVSTQQSQLAATDALVEAVTGSSAIDGPVGPSTYLFNMSALVPVNTSQNDPLVETRDMEFDGTITELSVVSTDAAQQAVGVRFGFSNGERILPRDEPSDARYVPLGGQVVENKPNVEVKSGEKVQFSFANNDPSEDHFVTALLQVQESQ